MSNKILAQLNLMGCYEIALGEKVISYTLKRSPKAKFIWLHIKRPASLSVTVPRRYNIRSLPAFLRSHSRWILLNLAKYSAETPVVTPPQTTTVPYLGKCLRVMQLRNGKGPPTIKLEENELIINLAPADRNLSAPELKLWLKGQASLLINTKVVQFSNRMDLEYNRITIRDQRSRWGSCSCRRNLNFNWRLIMAPEPVLDYVIVHELCHLKEMSHGKLFWTLVAKHCPQWREYRKWLNDHCRQFMQTGY